MEQRAFVRFIQACRRRINIAGFLRDAVVALMIGAGVGVIFQAAALALPFYYANLYTGLALLTAVLAALAAAFVKRTTMEQAALAIDRFGFEERIVTAYERLGQEGELLAMQREDAMRQLAVHKDRVRIPLCPSSKKLLGLAGMLVVLLVLTLMPAEMKERARELHAVREKAEEKEQEIEEFIDSLEELAQEELTPEQQAAVEEMMASLEISLSEYQQAYSADMLAAATEKLNYKYGEMNNQFENLLQDLTNESITYAAAVESMQELAQQLQDMSQMPPSQGGAGQNGQNGQGGNGDGTGNGSGQDEDGNGQGGGDGNGNGQDGGDGDGSGQGGDGSGDGSGGGRGTGSSDTPHDYVSVPNAIVDSGNLMGNVVDHDMSEYFFAQNGLSWEGTHISHEAVIGSYEQNAYEGIAAGRYPSGMEEVIKEYFASFNTK